MYLADSSVFPPSLFFCGFSRNSAAISREAQSNSEREHMNETWKRQCLSTAVLLVQQTVLMPWWPYPESMNMGRIVYGPVARRCLIPFSRRTRVCNRHLTASAPLPLPGAAERRRYCRGDITSARHAGRAGRFQSCGCEESMPRGRRSHGDRRRGVVASNCDENVLPPVLLQAPWNVEHHRSWAWEMAICRALAL